MSYRLFLSCQPSPQFAALIGCIVFIEFPVLLKPIWNPAHIRVNKEALLVCLVVVGNSVAIGVEVGLSPVRKFFLVVGQVVPSVTRASDRIQLSTVHQAVPVRVTDSRI